MGRHHLRETWYKSGQDLPKNVVQWQAFVNTIINLQVA